LNPGPPIILVIDDEPGIRDILSAILTRQGVEVHTAQSGEEGLQKVQSHSYDIIVTDLKMPGLSGDEVLEQVKRIKGNLPVVAMSGTPWLMGDSDFDGLLTKPFGKKALLDMIKSLVPSFSY